MHPSRARTPGVHSGAQAGSFKTVDFSSGAPRVVIPIFRRSRNHGAEKARLVARCGRSRFSSNPRLETPFRGDLFLFGEYVWANFDIRRVARISFQKGFGTTSMHHRRAHRPIRLRRCIAQGRHWSAGARVAPGGHHITVACEDTGAKQQEASRRAVVGGQQWAVSRFWPGPGKGGGDKADRTCPPQQAARRR